MSRLQFAYGMSPMIVLRTMALAQYKNNTWWELNTKHTNQRILVT